MAEPASIDPNAPGARPVRFDPELDAALGSFGEHRWEVMLADLNKRLGLPENSNLPSVGEWLRAHDMEGTPEWGDYIDAVDAMSDAISSVQG